MSYRRSLVANAHALQMAQRLTLLDRSRVTIAYAFSAPRSLDVDVLAVPLGGKKLELGAA
jgi:hypothetical protein